MQEQEKLEANFDHASRIAEIQLKSTKEGLPILVAVREEQKFALDLTNGITDKWLDLAKLLIGIAFPALVTLYSLNSESFNMVAFIILSAIMLGVGILIFFIAIRFKLTHLSPYLESSSSRLKLYTEWQITTSLKAANEDQRLVFEQYKKKFAEIRETEPQSTDKVDTDHDTA